MTTALKDIDLISAAGALAWALVALYRPELASLCSAEAAFAFAAIAATRGLSHVRAAMAAKE